MHACTSERRVGSFAPAVRVWHTCDAEVYFADVLVSFHVCLCVNLFGTRIKTQGDLAATVSYASRGDTDTGATKQDLVLSGLLKGAGGSAMLIAAAVMTPVLSEA